MILAWIFLQIFFVPTNVLKFTACVGSNQWTLKSHISRILGPNLSFSLQESFANNHRLDTFTDWSGQVTRVAWEFESLTLASRVIRIIAINDVETGAGRD